MAIRLDWTSELAEPEFSEQWIGKLEQLLQLAAKTENVPTGVVSLSFVDDAAIQLLNQEYRGIDHPTDVLSFAMEDDDDEELAQDSVQSSHDGSQPERLLGDIVISIPRAKEQSLTYGHTLEREIGFLFVHGFLHLIGYDHYDEAAEDAMFALQEQILQQAGLLR